MRERSALRGWDITALKEEIDNTMDFVYLEK